MTPRDLLLVATVATGGCDDYLLPGDAGGSEVDTVLDLLSQADPEAGLAAFQADCAFCHDPDGIERRAGPPIAPYVPTVDDRKLVVLVLNGRGAMPGFNGSSEEAADIVAWLRATFDSTE